MGGNPTGGDNGMRQWNGATTHGADTGPRAELGRELERSRRYDRSFALVRIHADSLNGQNGTGERARGQLGSTLRAVDRVWQSGGDYVYLLPECDRTHADGFVKRLAEAAGTELVTTIACFPEDGLTGGLLIELVLGDAAELRDARSSNGNGKGTAAAR
ncbi:MAG: hypothetical protein ACR2OD_04865, partial [Gaiellaceae bacterium]